MKLSASKAAKEVGVSVPTITRAIKSGKISAEAVEGGGWSIDPAELFRVFSPVTASPNDTPTSLGYEPPSERAVLEVQVSVLREQLALMQQAMADKDGVIADLRSDRDDLRQQRDRWQEQADRATRLLAGPPPAKASEPRQSWWRRLAG